MLIMKVYSCYTLFPELYTFHWIKWIVLAGE
jgi:hypothetical protein